MEETIIMDEQMQEMLAIYKRLKKEIEKEEAIEKKQIFSIISSRLDRISSLRNRIIECGCMAIGLTLVIGALLPIAKDFRIVTSVLVLIITAGIAVANRSINGDFVPDMPMSDYARMLKSRKQAQFWWIRITWILFAFWYGYSVGKFIIAPLPVWGKAICIVAVTVFVACMYYHITRIHNRIIGQYEGVILRLERPEAAEWIGE